MGVFHRQVDVFMKPEYHLPQTVWKQQYSASTVKEKDSNSPQCLKKASSSFLNTFRDGRERKAHITASIFPCSRCDSVEKTARALYCHYASRHFNKQISKRLGGQKSGQCPQCSSYFKSCSSFRSHQGIAHGLVEAYLEPQYHLELPEYVKKKELEISKLPVSLQMPEKGLEVPRSEGSCTLCSWVSSKRSYLIIHCLKTHFKKKFTEIWHSSGKSGKNARLCPICGWRSGDKFKFVYHLGAHHKMVESLLAESQFQRTDEVNWTPQTEDQAEDVEDSTFVAEHPIHQVTAWTLDIQGENGIKTEQEASEEQCETKIFAWRDMKIDQSDQVAELVSEDQKVKVEVQEGNGMLLGRS
jgi:hypothetical protein